MQVVHWSVLKKKWENIRRFTLVSLCLRQWREREDLTRAKQTLGVSCWDIRAKGNLLWILTETPAVGDWSPGVSTVFWKDFQNSGPVFPWWNLFPPPLLSCRPHLVFTTRRKRKNLLTLWTLRISLCCVCCWNYKGSFSEASKKVTFQTNIQRNKFKQTNLLQQRNTLVKFIWCQYHFSHTIRQTTTTHSCLTHVW